MGLISRAWTNLAPPGAINARVVSSRPAASAAGSTRGSVFSCRLVRRAGMSIGQPSFPQSLLISSQVFGSPIRAKNVVEIRNTQRGI